MSYKYCKVCLMFSGPSMNMGVDKTRFDAVDGKEALDSAIGSVDVMVGPTVGSVDVVLGWLGATAGAVDVVFVFSTVVDAAFPMVEEVAVDG
jgi:hypothetical protein